jgi:uncharacterized protein
VRTVVGIAVAGADTHERIDAVIPLLDEMVGEGMVTREKVQIIGYRGGP